MKRSSLVIHFFISTELTMIVKIDKIGVEDLEDTGTKNDRQDPCLSMKIGNNLVGTTERYNPQSLEGPHLISTDDILLAEYKMPKQRLFSRKHSSAWCPLMPWNPKQ